MPVSIDAILVSIDTRRCPGEETPQKGQDLAGHTGEKEKILNRTAKVNPRGAPATQVAEEGPPKGEPPEEVAAVHPMVMAPGATLTKNKIVVSQRSQARNTGGWPARWPNATVATKRENWPEGAANKQGSSVELTVRAPSSPARKNTRNIATGNVAP